MTGFHALPLPAIGLLLLASAVRADQPVPVVAPIGEIPGGVTVIEGAEDLDGFANAVTDIGDVDGDGLRDLAFLSRRISISIHDADNESRILFGSAALPARIDLADWPRWGITLTAVQRDSCPVAGLGDLDGDGYDDMGFAETFIGDRDPTHAAVILFGARNLPLEIDADTFSGCRVARLHPDPNLHGTGSTGIVSFTSLAAGDLDGDGRRDVAAAVLYRPDPENPAPEGLVYLVPGAWPFPPDVLLADVGVSRPGCKVRMSGQDRGYFPSFGSRMAVADFDRDGLDDLALLGPHLRWTEGGAARREESIFVVFGRRDWPAALDVADPREPGVCRITAADTFLGDLPLLAGPDLDGDAVPDLLAPVEVGQWGEDGTCALVSGWRLKPGVLRLQDVAVDHFTAKGPNLSAEVVAHLRNWRGDGRPELAFGQFVYSKGSSLPLESGRVRTFPADAGFPFPACIDDLREGTVDVLGSTQSAHLGALVLGTDLDGDGRDELVASAPGLRTVLVYSPEMLAPLAGEHRGRLAIVHGETDFRGPLGGDRFLPLSGDVKGGGRLLVTGRGFDAGTEVLLGDTALAVVDRPDSRGLVALIPPWPAAGRVPVRLRRGTDTFEFAAPFAFIVSDFPLQLDVHDLGERGTSMPMEDRLLAGCRADCFSPHGRGHDFTGDGLADLVLSSLAGGACPGRVYLLPGSRSFPSDLRGAALAGRLSVIESEVQYEFGIPGLGAEVNAITVGDMDGDGRSELAIRTSPWGSPVYIVFGHDIPTGTTTVQDLVRSGRACRIDGMPDACPDIFEAGDVNGDGLADLGINPSHGVPYEIGADTVDVGLVALVLGRPRFPPAIDFADLPKVYGRPPGTSWLSTYVDPVDRLGDVDGDGFDDIVLQCEPLTEEGMPMGPPSIYILFGRRDWPPSTDLATEIALGSACELLRESGGTPHESGAGACAIGDQDGDGKDDIGVMVVPSSTPEAKSFRVVMGGTREKLAAPRVLNRPDGFDAIFPASPGYTHFGVRPGGGRDFDGDGIPDILIGDNHWDDSPPSRAIVLFGGNLKERAGPIGEVEGKLEILSHEPYEDEGYPLAFGFGGDIDGDGREDLVLSSQHGVFIYYNPLRVVDFHHPFRRADANADGQVDLSDAIAVLGFLFLGVADPPCLEAADCDDSGEVDITDAIFLLGSLFLGTRPLPAPGPDCGPDPTGDDLGCTSSPACR